MTGKYFGEKIRLYVVLMFLFVPPFLLAQEKNLDELLELSLDELSNIQVITPLKIVQKLYEAPGVVKVITAEQIKERGYFTLEEALSDLPGLQFRNIVGLNSYVFMRGVPSQNNLILVLVDGIPINELNSGGFYGGGQYNLATVERLEILYGPASVLYGTNAISGIINIITKAPRDYKGVQAAVLFGRFNTKYLDVAYGYHNPNKNFGLRIAGMVKTTEKADLKGVKGDNNWSRQMENFEDDYSLDLKLTYKDFIFGLTFQDKQSSASTYYSAADTIYRDTGSLWNICFFNAFLKHYYSFSPKWTLSSRLYYRNAVVKDNSVLVVTDAAQFGYYRPNHLTGLESLLNFKPSEKSNLIGGIVIETENLAESYSITQSNSPLEKPPRPPRPKMTHSTLFSSYLQTQYRLFKKVQFTAGIRFDTSSVYGEVFTPRLGVVGNWKRWTVKLLYNEAFRAPKPWDYSDGLGNPSLDPERMESLELFTAYHISSHLKISLSLYTNELHGLLTKEFIGENWRWINGSQINTNGLELAFDYAQGITKSYFNYTYNRSVYSNGEKVPEISPHTANMGILFSLGKHIKLDIRGNYLGKRKNVKIITATGSDMIADAFILHSTLSILGVKGFDFHLIVKNLGDTEYYHPSNRPPDRYRQPQRTIMIKVEYKFK